MNWGIIGLGKISHKFVSDLLLVNDAILYGVASRSKEKAEEYRIQYDAVSSFGSYSELLADDSIDIVYIATPHDTHALLSIEAMRAGKHVLCEKPLGVNAKEVEAIIKVANETGQFMMEAFWARFNPSINEVLERIDNGDLGEVNYVSADFTFARNDTDDSRMLNPHLAGGSLLDMGVYPVFLAYSALGYPDDIKSVGTLHTTGVDLQTATVMNYKSGVASIMSGFRSRSRMQAQICGTKATIILHPVWHETQGYTIFDAITLEETIVNLPTKGRGYSYEIEESMECIRTEKKESMKWPLSSSLDMLRITDEIRKQVGVIYPFED